MSQAGSVKSGVGLAIAAMLLSLVTLTPWTPSLGEQGGEKATLSVTERQPPLLQQSPEQVAQKSDGCISCHEGIEPMHASSAVKLGCTDCHGGNSQAKVGSGSTQENADYETVKKQAHIAPRFPEQWTGKNGKYSAANPENTYTLLNREDPKFIRFINPGDLRVAQEACGACHQPEVNSVRKSPMTTSSIFWVAAGYANGIISTKHGLFGESYARDGSRAPRPSSRPLLRSGAWPGRARA